MLEYAWLKCHYSLIMAYLYTAIISNIGYCYDRNIFSSNKFKVTQYSIIIILNFIITSIKLAF